MFYMHTGGNIETIFDSEVYANIRGTEKGGMINNETFDLKARKLLRYIIQQIMMEKKL